jgi:membrane associated rhomboid family serine protease
LAFIPLYDSNPLRRIGHPWVSWGLIAANVAVYFLVETGGYNGDAYEASVYAWGLIPAAFNGVMDQPTLPFVGESATLLTYAFLHADFWHLAGNMVFLWVLGDNVEDALGHFRYLVFYALCAIAAGYAFVLSAPASEAPLIGASGAVAGNIAAYLLLYPRAKIWILLFLRIPVRLRGVYVLGFWILFPVFAAFYGDGADQVAWWAHLGGLATGALLVVVMRQRGVPLLARALPEPAPETAKHPASAAPLASGDQPVQSPPDPPHVGGPKGPWG